MSTLKHVPVSSSTIIHVDMVRKVKFQPNSVILHVRNESGGCDEVVLVEEVLVKWWLDYLKDQAIIGVATYHQHAP